MLEICEVSISMPWPLFVNVLFCTVMLLAGVSAVTVMVPEFTPMRPESFV